MTILKAASALTLAVRGNDDPPELRGTGFGTFSLVTGFALLLASVTARALWNALGLRGTFFAGAIFTGLALAGLWLLKKRLEGDALPTRP